MDVVDSDEDIALYDSDSEDFMQGNWEQVLPNDSEGSEVIEKETSTKHDEIPCENGFIERMKLNDHKAGMEGLDKEKINKIIYEASKGSKFYENEKRKEERVRQRVESMKRELLKFKESDKQRALLESNKVLNELEKEYDFSRTLVHVDMDAFYAAVEIRDNPKLKDVPMAVGGNSMLSTSNYLARKFGVRAAMPGFIGKKLCPELVIVPLHFDKYREVSKEIREIFREYDPNFSPMSLDEAYLDLTEYLASKDKSQGQEKDKRNPAEIVVEEIRTRIQCKTKLTASAGIAPNLMLSKICSDMNKPNGQYYLKPDKETVDTFVRDLPIRKIFGIGRVTEQMLHALDIVSCRDILQKRELLYLLFSATSFQYFMRVALGISHNRIVHDDRKSMSVERTFGNESRKEKLVEICRSLCEDLANDLSKEKLKIKNVTLKYKLSSFVTRTRSKTLSYPIGTSEELFFVAKGILLNEIQTVRKSGDMFELRLMGVRGCHFFDKTHKNLKQNTVEDFFSAGSNCTSTSKVREEDCTSKIDNNESGPCFSGSNEKMIQCPVCGIEQRTNDLNIVNAHIDSCLTKQTIKDLLKEQEAIEPKSCPNERKRKQEKQLTKKENKKKKTLISYWKK